MLRLFGERRTRRAGSWSALCRTVETLCPRSVDLTPLGPFLCLHVYVDLVAFSPHLRRAAKALKVTTLHKPLQHTDGVAPTFLTPDSFRYDTFGERLMNSGGSVTSRLRYPRYLSLFFELVKG